MFISCSSNDTEQTKTVEPIMPDRLEIVSNNIQMGYGGYIWIVKDNVTGNEFIVGRAIESIAVCPIIKDKE